MSTTTDLSTLVINYLTQAQYDALISGGTVEENEIYMTPSLGISGLMDIFYPVGSYYETSNTSFNPNTAWGGTWVLETEGQVHISAGTNYAVAGALTNASDGGAETVTLTTNEMPAHTHGSKSLTGTARMHGDVGMVGENANPTGIFSRGNTASTTYSPNWTSGTSYYLNIDATHEHDSVGSGQAHNNMQPYIVVNRWHRTA